MLLSELLDWLHPLEDEARAVYEEVAQRFADNPPLAAFLHQLAADETGHRELLHRAQQLIANTAADGPASILVDAETRQRLAGPLQQLRDQLRANTLTADALLPAIVQVEFSEWNHIFLYVLAEFRQYAPVFQHVAAVIQQHQQRITDFLDALPADQRPRTPLSLPPKVWDRRILVADDNEGLRLALEMFLSPLGQVTVAADGQQALDSAQHQFFDAIVSDVDMPGLTGIEFYRALASAGSPDQHRFIFCTGREPSELQPLVGNSRILTKPFALETLRQAVQAVLDQEE